MLKNAAIQLRTFVETKKAFQEKIEQHEELKKLGINTIAGAIGYATEQTFGVNLMNNYLPTGEEDESPHADHYYEEP